MKLWSLQCQGWGGRTLGKGSGWIWMRNGNQFSWSQDNEGGRFGHESWGHGGLVCILTEPLRISEHRSGVLWALTGQCGGTCWMGSRDPGEGWLNPTQQEGDSDGHCLGRGRGSPRTPRLGYLLSRGTPIHAGLVCHGLSVSHAEPYIPWNRCQASYVCAQHLANGRC